MKSNTGDNWTKREQYEYYIQFDETKILTIKNSQNDIRFFDNDPNDQKLITAERDMNGTNYIMLRFVNNGSMGFAMGDYKDLITINSEQYKSLNNNCVLRMSKLKSGNYVFVQYITRSNNPFPGRAYLFRVVN